MTSAVKDELSRLRVTKTCCRRAEVSSLLRFAGGLHIIAGRVVVEAELDTGSAARRLRREVHELYGHNSDVHLITAGGLRKGTCYVVRVVRDGEGLARQTGLLDVRGRPVRGAVHEQAVAQRHAAEPELLLVRRRRRAHPPSTFGARSA